MAQVNPGEPRPLQVLFVCTGNICRSAFADRLSAQLVPAREVAFSSAGIGALAGNGMDELMAAELSARGGDPSGFVARQLEPPMIAGVDLLIPMERVHRRWILEEAPAVMRRALLLGQLRRAAQELPEDVRGAEFIAQVPGVTGRPERGDDIADPYRRGPVAAQECAQEISEAVALVLPRLY